MDCLIKTQQNIILWIVAGMWRDITSPLTSPTCLSFIFTKHQHTVASTGCKNTKLSNKACGSQSGLRGPPGVLEGVAGGPQQKRGIIYFHYHSISK